MLVSSRTAASLALLLIPTTSTSAARFGKQQNEFLRAMKSSNVDGSRRHRRQQDQEAVTPTPEAFAQEIQGDTQRSAWFQRKLVEKATYVPPDQVRARQQAERELQNGNNYGYNSGNANNANNNNAAAADGTDDYFSASGAWDNAFGFDVAQYSMSYLRCAAVRQFDDNLAAQEDSTTVFSTKHFAIFRFCPAKTCEGINYEEGANYNNNANGNYNANANKNYNYAMYGANYQANRQQQSAYGANQDAQYGPITGAAGEGCQSNYGEYMLELEDYLQIMAEYRAERFETYCEYCEECAYNVYLKWMKWSKNQDYSNNNNNNNHRKLYDMNEEGWKRELIDNASFETERELGNFDPLQICPEYQTCKVYEDVCKNYDDGLEDYFECTEVEGNNNRVAYVGPACSKDGVTVTLGVYSDEYCNDYIGDSVNIRNFLGYDLDEDALSDYVKGSITSLTKTTDDMYLFDPTDQLCIPCRASAQLWENEGNLYHDDANFEDDEVTELCETLYKTSARCDHHFRNYNTKTKYSKYYDQNYMQLSCDFIDSVVNGEYDDMGFLVIDNSTLPNGEKSFLKNNIYYEEYGHFAQEVTGFQIFGLIASILAVGFLALWAATLHRSLSKKGPWRPRKAAAMGKDPVDMSRQNSGIVMGRSQSNASHFHSSE